MFQHLLMYLMKKLGTFLSVALLPVLWLSYSFSQDLLLSNRLINNKNKTNNNINSNIEVKMKRLNDLSMEVVKIYE
ncbi:GSCOCG00002652001-RA-CDS [Cotesia congregata]|nr:GSCOCG00002652001-RA-CDS [Cotesia congregata]